MGHGERPVLSATSEDNAHTQQDVCNEKGELREGDLSAVFTTTAGTQHVPTVTF